MLLLLQRTRELCEISFGDHMSKRFEYAKRRGCQNQLFKSFFGAFSFHYRHRLKARIAGRGEMGEQEGEYVTDWAAVAAAVGDNNYCGGVGGENKRTMAACT